MHMQTLVAIIIAQMHDQTLLYIPVAMRADPRADVDETLICLPLRKAPPPRVAVNVSPRIGL